MKAAALCAGYGGLELGLQLAGFDIDLRWYAEIDKHASTVFAGHYPGIPNLGDLTEITDPEPVDLLAAGFPCQPVSTAGKRQGVNDERWLIDDVCRVASDAGARWLVLENVAGIFTANRGYAFYQVLRALAENGFAAEWGSLRAADVGAPHGRLRWFCVAYAEGAERRGTEHELLGASVGSAAEHRERNSETTADPDGSSRENSERGVGLPDPSGLGAATTDADGYGYGPWSDAGGMGRMDGGDAGPSRERQRSRSESGDRGDAATTDAGCVGSQVPAERRQSTVKVAGGVGETRRVDFGPYTDAVRRWEHVTGRHAPEPTDDKRRLNPRFVEWMMGLPDGWVCDHVDGRSHQLKILGNGVVPQQAAEAIRQLRYRMGQVA